MGVNFSTRNTMAKVNTTEVDTAADYHGIVWNAIGYLYHNQMQFLVITSLLERSNTIRVLKIIPATEVKSAVVGVIFSTHK